LNTTVVPIWGESKLIAMLQQGLRVQIRNGDERGEGEQRLLGQEGTTFLSFAISSKPYRLRALAAAEAAHPAIVLF
jgi:hypothetical protein